VPILIDEPLLGPWVIGHQVDTDIGAGQLVDPLIVDVIACEAYKDDSVILL